MAIVTSHEREELREVNSAVAFGIDLFDHVLELSLSRAVTKRVNDGSELLCGDYAISILIEKRESLFELCDLLFC